MPRTLEAEMTEWGNPAVKTFRKKHIRTILVGDLVLYAHIEVAEIIAEILNSAQASGVRIPPDLKVWVKPEEGTPMTDLVPANFGVAFPYIEGLQYEGWGFERIKDEIVYQGDIASARKLSDAAESSRVLRMAQYEDLSVIPRTTWVNARPGQREVNIGDRGDDVVFLQELFDMSDRDGVFSKGASEYIKTFQKRFNVEQTGIVDAVTWKLILPRPTRFSLTRGDAGHDVRVLQSILVAYDWDDTLRVNGRFDYATDMAMRRLQQGAGLRISGKVRAPEWTYLLGRPLDQQT